MDLLIYFVDRTMIIVSDCYVAQSLTAYRLVIIQCRFICV